MRLIILALEDSDASTDIALACALSQGAVVDWTAVDGNVALHREGDVLVVDGNHPEHPNMMVRTTTRIAT